MDSKLRNQCFGHIPFEVAGRDLRFDEDESGARAGDDVCIGDFV